MYTGIFVCVHIIAQEKKENKNEKKRVTYLNIFFAVVNKSARSAPFSLSLFYFVMKAVAGGVVRQRTARSVDAYIANPPISLSMSLF